MLRCTLHVVRWSITFKYNSKVTAAVIRQLDEFLSPPVFIISLTIPKVPRMAPTLLACEQLAYTIIIASIVEDFIMDFWYGFLIHFFLARSKPFIGRCDSKCSRRERLFGSGVSLKLNGDSKNIHRRTTSGGPQLNKQAFQRYQIKIASVMCPSIVMLVKRT